ncbi:MAG: trigger factor [Ruminococcaceae bacterium]|nr:trigger factor [Oscillospiraceae bacterium]
MIVTNAAREKNTVTFEVRLDAAEFEKYVNEAYKKNKSKIMVTGFRKGRAPRMVIEGMYGKEVFYDDAMNDAAPEAFAFAVEQEKLNVVGRPAIENVEVTEETGLVLSYKVDVWPETTLGQYKGLEAEKVTVTVSDEEVDADIERQRKQNGRIQTVEREAKEGDTVNIDYVGTREGVPFDGGTADGYNLGLGSGTFVPGFEEKLVGIKAGEERDIDITFPENYVEHLAGKDVVFHVKCNEVKEEILPELDDEFAKDHDYDTLAEMREASRKRLADGRQSAVENAWKDMLVEQAVENMTVEIPQGMIEERLDGIMNEYAQYMASQGMKLENYVQMIGTDMATFRENSRSAAEKQTRTEVLLRAVAEAEKIEASEEDLEKEYNELAQQYGIDVDTVRAAINVEMIKDQIVSRKAMNVIVDSGIAVEPKEAPKAEEAE